MVREQKESWLDQSLTRRDAALILSSLGLAFVAGGIVGYVGRDGIRELLPTSSYSPEGKFIANEGEFHIQQVEMPIIVPIEFNKNTITELNTNRLDHSRIIVVQDGTVAVFRKPELISPVFLDKNAIKPNDSYMYIYAAAVFGQEYNGWVRKQGVEGETFAPSSHSLVHENKEYMGGLWYVLMSRDFYHQGDGVDDIGYKYCNPKGELLDENEAPYYIPSAFLRPVLIEGINPAVV